MRFFCIPSTLLNQVQHHQRKQELRRGWAVYVPFSAVLEKGFIHRFNIRMGTSLRNADGSTINFKD